MNLKSWALVLGVGFYLSSPLFSKPRPNIIFVLADDLGWAELGCYGNNFNETPNLDRMAREGMRFTQAYASAPVCSPYRASLLTGLYPARLGILDYLRPNSANRLSTDLVTLPEILKENGYSTGMIGKWHLTGYRFHEAEFETRPTDHGFDWNFGSEVKSVGNGANTWPYIFRTQPIRWIDIKKNRLGEKENLTDRLNLEAVDFIRRNKERPFFLYLSHYAPHTILNGRPDLVAKYRKKHPPGKSGRKNCYICEDAGLGKGDPGNHWAVDHNPHLAAMIEGIDDGIGKMRDELSRQGLLENTIFIFSSDNGGETTITSNAPLRGGKSQLYEGGIRVPLIIQWPKRMPAGTLNEEPIINTDFYPTLLDATKIDLTRKVDGSSALDNWKDPKVSREESLYWHYPLDRPHFLGGFSGGAVRIDDWKLIENFNSGSTELYSLGSDPFEKNDISQQNPKKVDELKNKLSQWRDQVSARIPSAPLLTDTRSLYFSDHFSGQASERLWYNGDWLAEDGILQRVNNGAKNTRIFLREALYGDSLIRFDFQFNDSSDIRLVTGSNGHYNAIVHLRRDHFYIQTAKDSTGPYFSYRHSECSYNFDPDRWYTMTIEFIDDHLIAHIDRDHIAYANHPIINKERSYFAFQVDDKPAFFDNIQIFQAKKNSNFDSNLEYLISVTNKYPIKKSLKEEYDIKKTNAHEWFYQRKEGYRSLVKRVEELDLKRKEQFPSAFSSNKELKKEALSLRKNLSKKDSKFKELLRSTHRATRAIEVYIIEQQPEVADYPNSRRKAAIEKLRSQYSDSREYKNLIRVLNASQETIETAYPKAYISDEEIKEYRKAEHKKIKNDPIYKDLQKARAEAYRNKEEYLFKNDIRLSELRQILSGK